MDVLASSTIFPALTLTVSIASNAPASLTNTATVSGADEVDISNDTASDVTTVLPGGPNPRRRGVDAPSGFLSQGASAALNTVTNAFAHSEEYLAKLVIQDYSQLLHRTAAAAEVSSWVGQLKSGLSDEQMLASFASSAEYYRQAGGSDQAWLQSLYRDVLGRDVDAGGRAAWLQAIASGASRLSIAYAIVKSVEHETSVVAADYQNYLGRTAGPAEIAGWVNNLQRGMSQEQVLAAFLTSDEFFAGHGSSTLGWLDGVYELLLQRNADTSGFGYWNEYLRNQFV
jgi:hypothetical protein